MSTTIDFIRHGEPVGGSRYRGNQIDDPLSEKGWQQMLEAISGERPWQAIITSPMLRCKAFAERVSQEMSVPMSIETAFQEVGFGAWEGKTSTELKAEDPDQIHRFYNDPENRRPEGSEPLNDFMQRVGNAIDRVRTQYTGQHVLVVAHAGVLRATIVYTLQTPLASMYRMKIAYATRIRLVEEDKRPLSLVLK